jgi:hypothetical protein
MGLLDGTTNREYYQGNDHANYQFTSLQNVIEQFIVAYVGENKIIPKVSKLDVAFHAQRALQELSFDTLKSIKSQEIVLPPSLTMILPQDYVNYTKLSFVDSSGIKHPLYKTNSTSNPFSIKQNADLAYDFTAFANGGFITNYNFEGDNNLVKNGDPKSGEWARSHFFNPNSDTIGIQSNELTFTHGSKNFFSGEFTGSRVYVAYQAFDVSGIDLISIDAVATAAAAASLSHGGTKGAGNIRIGVTTLEPTTTALNMPGYDNSFVSVHNSSTNQFNRVGSPSFGYNYFSPLLEDEIFNLNKEDGTRAFEDFTVAAEETKTFDVSTANISPDANNQKWVYVLVISHIKDFSTPTDPSNSTPTGAVSDLSINKVNSITVSADVDVNYLQANPDSKTWANYKSSLAIQNSNDDYLDNDYYLMSGNRYGLDPQHAQINGSYYVDELKGKINFSSNISGKTVILDYISDSLGTDAEMQVHKFAEEAMYKCIAHAIISTSSYGQQLVPRFKKEKFAAVRQAKLRLSSIKLEELTQVLRGKSKQIKH